MPSVGTQTERGTYCGLKPGIPADSPGRCFLKGRKSGFVAGLQKGKEMASKKAHVLTELTTQASKKTIAEMIEKRGLTYLKTHLHVDKLNKDEIRSIMIRLTGTPQAVPRYSSMTLAQLRNELVQRGWKR